VEPVVTHQTSYLESTVVGHTTADAVRQLGIRLATVGWFVQVCCNVLNQDIQITHIATDLDKALYGGQPDLQLLTTFTAFNDSQHLCSQAVF